jgi:hypothetical protein
MAHLTFRVKHGGVVTQLKEINSGVPQGSVPGSVLYLLYTDLPVALDSTTATYADDTAILLVQQSYRSVPAFTRKSLLHLGVVKKNVKRRAHQ